MAPPSQKSVLMIRSSLMAETRTNSSLLIALRHDARIPLHRQIEASIRDSIRAGRLPRGSSLPATRLLAADLGVSRGVVVEAYAQLTAEGYLASRVGGYTQVAAGPAPAATGLRLAREPAPPIDLSYGRADVSSFPRAAWLRAIRGALADAPNSVFGYLTGSGWAEYEATQSVCGVPFGATSESMVMHTAGHTASQSLQAMQRSSPFG